MEKAGKWIQRAGTIFISAVVPFISIFIEVSLHSILELFLLGGLITLWGNILTKEEEQSLPIAVFGCIGLACYLYIESLWLAIAMGISGAILTGLNYLMNRKSADEEPVQLHNE
ncbi:hypothetical protein [Jeotgalibacillus malaysiensis]|uniref:hypothetical protein n=1 Tax=Jeotgalibacillus malaysiensis TaxID=1508404 RepID=UPI00384C5E1C